ncbi:hypothetical protein MYX84_09065 [Acidobacteria bacterium AH-259-O06]|nr:hypothetical protein [Acidobacteria bacterium AH-259-O06]
MSKACRKTSRKQSGHGIGRRELLGGGGLLATSTLFYGGSLLAAPAAPERKKGPEVYRSLGVRPLINCKGTYTIITGSLTLPEVKRAMEEASRYYVHLDELMDAVGRRLAELTRTEWGIVTAGCSAAETLATCACVAGANPENIQRLPNLDGLKDEVIIPRYSRNVYDHAVRMVGVKLVTVDNMQELEAAFGAQTAMVYILACPDDAGPFGLEPIAKVARRKGVPVFVDAAAEDLTPEVHLGRGADLVAYSGGKAIRGPQCAGLLLGRKDLCQAAWVNSAPHHAFGRSLKVGKEEIMGMLAAAEMWYKRDHKAEWKSWESWLGEIARQVKKVSAVSTEVLQPGSLSNRSPRLEIKWDGSSLGISGEEVYEQLLNGDPRIILARATGGYGEGMEKSSVQIMPWMMQSGEEKIVASRLYEVLSDPPKIDRPAQPRAQPADVAGRWDVQLEFTLGKDDHIFFFEQEGERLVGTHLGRTLVGGLKGRVEGNEIDFQSSQPYEGTRLPFRFTGRVQGDSIYGAVDLGEYGQARWMARRYHYRS